MFTLVIHFKYLKIFFDMHFKTPIQAYIEQNVKLPGRESRGDVGSNPVGVSIFSIFFSLRFVFVLLYL